MMKLDKETMTLIIKYSNNIKKRGTEINLHKQCPICEWNLWYASSDEFEGDSIYCSSMDCHFTIDITELLEMLKNYED